MILKTMLVNILDNLFILSSSNVSSTSSWLIFAKTIGQLFFLLILFLGLYFCVNKIRTMQNSKNFKTKNIQIIERKFLNNFTSLTLVKINNKVLLLGTGKEKINLLAEFDEDDLNLSNQDINNKFKNIFNKNFLNTDNKESRGVYEDDN